MQQQKIIDKVSERKTKEKHETATDIIKGSKETATENTHEERHDTP